MKKIGLLQIGAGDSRVETRRVWEHAIQNTNFQTPRLLPLPFLRTSCAHSLSSQPEQRNTSAFLVHLCR